MRDLPHVYLIFFDKHKRRNSAMLIGKSIRCKINNMAQTIIQFLVHMLSLGKSFRFSKYNALDEISKSVDLEAEIWRDPQECEVHLYVSSKIELTLVIWTRGTE